MKQFFKNAFASTTGIFIFIFIIFFIVVGIGFISTLGELFMGGKVKDSSVLEIKFDEPIKEGPTEDETTLFELEKQENLYHKNVLIAIEKAKNDDRIKGISLKLSNIQGGITQIQDIRDAIKDFKTSGKFVYAYHNNSTQGAYYLSTIADKIYLNPTGMLEFFGLSSEIMFFKNFGDKYGINFNVIRHGEYKSAVEPFISNSISEENKRQVTELLNGIWKQIANEVSQSRKIPLNNLNAIVDELQSFLPEFALKHKLVDGLLQEVQYDNLIKKQLNITDEKQEIPYVSLSDYLLDVEEVKFNDEKIAILHASGEIFPGDESQNIQSEYFKKQIRAIKDDESIKALVLRINSPGGSANSSDEILHELKELKLKKPIVVSFGDIAASGGYYIAMEADSIFAQKSTITGSIGVLGMIPDVKTLVNNNGINTEIVQTNKNSYFYSPTAGISEGGKKIITNSIESIYNRFVTLVAKNRKKSFQQIDSIARGRVWTGEDALKMGLVDKIGNLNRSIQSAAKLAKLTEYETIHFPTPEDPFEKFFKELSGEKSSKIQTALKQELGTEEYELYQKIKELKTYKGIQMIAPIQKIKF